MDLKAARECLTLDESERPPWAIPGELVEALADLGPRFEELWHQGLFSPAQQKALLRTLVEKVIVQRIRLQHGLYKRPELAGPRSVPGYLTVGQLAKHLNVSTSWIHGLIDEGTIIPQREPGTKLYLFPDTPEALAQLGQVVEERNPPRTLSAGIELVDPSGHWPPRRT